MSSRRSASASAIAPIRKPWRGAHPQATMASHERAGKFSRALVAAQARSRTGGAGAAGIPPQTETRHRRGGARGEWRCIERAGRQAPKTSRSISPACRRSSRSAPTPTSRAFLRPGVPAGLDACGASSRLVVRSGHSRLRRAGRERVGLQRSRTLCPASGRSSAGESRAPACASDRVNVPELAETVLAELPKEAAPGERPGALTSPRANRSRRRPTRAARRLNPT